MVATRNIGCCDTAAYKFRERIAISCHGPPLIRLQHAFIHAVEDHCGEHDQGCILLEGYNVKANANFHP
jgi:hypothetical protein